MANTPFTQSVATPAFLPTNIHPGTTIMVEVFYRLFCGQIPEISRYDETVQSVPTYKIAQMVTDARIYGEQRAAVSMLLELLPDEMFFGGMVKASDTMYIVEYIVTNWPDWALSPVGLDYDMSPEWWMENIHDPSEAIWLKAAEERAWY